MRALASATVSQCRSVISALRLQPQHMRRLVGDAEVPRHLALQPPGEGQRLLQIAPKPRRRLLQPDALRQPLHLVVLHPNLPAERGCRRAPLNKTSAVPAHAPPDRTAPVPG